MRICYAPVLLLLFSNCILPIVGSYLELYEKFVRVMELKQDLITIRKLLMDYKDVKLEVDEDLRRDADLILCLDKIVQHSEHRSFLSNGIDVLHMFRGRVPEEEENEVMNEIEEYTAKVNKIDAERKIKIQETLRLLGNELERLKDLVVELDNLEYIKNLEYVMESNVEQLMNKYGLLEALTDAFNALHETDNSYDLEKFAGLEEQINEYTDITHIIYLRMGLHMLVTKLEIQLEKIEELDGLLNDINSLEELKDIISRDEYLLKEIRFIDGLEGFTVENLNDLDDSVKDATGIEIIKKLQQDAKKAMRRRVIDEINAASVKLIEDIAFEALETNKACKYNENPEIITSASS